VKEFTNKAQFLLCGFAPYGKSSWKVDPSKKHFKNPTEKRWTSFMEKPGFHHLRKKIVNTLLFVQSVIKMKSHEPIIL